MAAPLRTEGLGKAFPDTSFPRIPSLGELEEKLRQRAASEDIRLCLLGPWAPSVSLPWSGPDPWEPTEAGEGRSRGFLKIIR